MDYYGTATAFTEYHAARGRDVSEYDSAQIETGLLVASEWLDGSFGDRWPGFKAGNRDQVRDWPRSWVQDRDGYPVDFNSVPVEIDHATYEAAYRWLQDDTSLVVDYTPGKYKRVSIDGAISVEFRSLDASTTQKQFPIIGNILARLLGGRNVSSLSSGIMRV